MSKKVKSSSKLFISDKEKIRNYVLTTMNDIARIVGSTLGPGGENVLIESDLHGIPSKNTKDGVSVFKSLGYSDPFRHLIMEQTRDVASKTASEAGDGTTTATILANAFITNLFGYIKANPKMSPQKVAREMKAVLREDILPFIEENTIKVNTKNKKVLKDVATVSANGDSEMATAVIKCFEEVGFGESSHVTIQELSGPDGYDVEVIEGLPIPIGFEESIGKFANAFINDQGNQRCVLEKPLFLLYNGMVNDTVQFNNILEEMGQGWADGKSDYKNLVFVSHGFDQSVLTALAMNFANPGTINIVPLITPMSQIANSQTDFLMDLGAFTGATVFGMDNNASEAAMSDLGIGMEQFECYRFRATVVGECDEVLIEERADQLEQRVKSAESKIEKILLQERLGKLTNGIAKLKVFAGSSGELKEKHDRAEDAVCAVRATISDGALAGGGRTLLDLSMLLAKKHGENSVAMNVLVPSLIEPVNRLLANAGYNPDDATEIITTLMSKKTQVFDLENHEFGSAKKLGLYDAKKAVEEAITNAIGIATVMGTMSGIVCYPRDNQAELDDASEEREFQRVNNKASEYKNEANHRP